MSAFPFSPEQVAHLTARSRATGAGEGAKPPIAGQVVMHNGAALLPTPDGRHEWLWVHSGVHLAWLPVPTMDGAIVVQFGGVPDEQGRATVGLAAFLTRDGLNRLATDLRSIVDQLEPSP